MASTADQITEVMEKRGLSRKAATQWLARREKQATKSEAKVKAQLKSDLARATAPKLAVVADPAKKAAKEKAPRETKFKMDMASARVKAMFKEHKTVSATALALGFPKGKGNNRTHAALVKLGLVAARKGDK